MTRKLPWKRHQFRVTGRKHVKFTKKGRYPLTSSCGEQDNDSYFLITIKDVTRELLRASGPVQEALHTVRR